MIIYAKSASVQFCLFSIICFFGETNFFSKQISDYFDLFEIRSKFIHSGTVKPVYKDKGPGFYHNHLVLII